MLLFTFPGNEPVAHELLKNPSFKEGRWTYRHFPDGESYVRLEEEVKTEEVTVICSLHNPDPLILPLILLADILKESGAKKITLLASYLAYMRQDKSFKPGESVAAKYFAELISPYFDKLITVDPHLHRIKSLDEIYSIETKVVRSAPFIAEWIKANVHNPIVIGPDEESLQWAKEVAGGAGASYTVLKKERLGDRQVKISIPDPFILKDKTPVLVDDIISTGQTMLGAIRHLKEQGFREIYVICVHAIFSDQAYKMLKETGAHVFSCNTIPHESNGIVVRFEEGI